MGLRIIDKHRRPPVEVSDADRLAGLEAATHAWAMARGDAAHPGMEQEFVATFRRVRERLTSPAEMTAMATRIRAGLLNGDEPGKKSHYKVDIATLLELL